MSDCYDFEERVAIVHEGCPGWPVEAAETCAALLAEVTKLRAEITRLSVKATPARDETFWTFQAAYPPHRRSGGVIIQYAYVESVKRAGGDPAVLQQALEQQVRSVQWRDPALVPAMHTWLTEDRWHQVLPTQAPVKSAPQGWTTVTGPSADTIAEVLRAITVREPQP